MYFCFQHLDFVEIEQGEYPGGKEIKKKTNIKITLVFIYAILFNKSEFEEMFPKLNLAEIIFKKKAIHGLSCTKKVGDTKLWNKQFICPNL